MATIDQPWIQPVGQVLGAGRVSEGGEEQSAGRQPAVTRGGQSYPAMLAPALNPG